MKHYEDFGVDDKKFSVGNQPRKTMLRKNKKEYAFKKIENEINEFDKQRNSYKRSAIKNIARAQVFEDEFIA